MVYVDIENIIKIHNGSIITEKQIKRRKANLVDFPDDLDKEIKKALCSLGINKLYSHQADVFNLVNSGNNIILTTGTSSGKSLAFYLPIINTILRNPLSKALLIYPTKALAQDQKVNLDELLKAMNTKVNINIGVYDGDTPINERNEIRRKASIILTNPDMLNATFLPNHCKYGFENIFNNLSYIMLDELHVYRGAFGSHVANLIKRINRICNYHQSKPQFLCSSATIANPKEHAEELCMKEFKHINNDGSFFSGQNIIFYSVSENTIDDIISQVVQIAGDLVNNDVRSIIFCRNRRDVEVISKEIKYKLEKENGTYNKSNKVSPYRAGYTPLERREIENNLKDGKLLCVVSTNALELGIDIGSLDVAIMAGFPGTKASFWQQAGRAGRRSGKSNIILMLTRYNPIENYISQNPNWLLDSSIENALINPSNLNIQKDHIRAAAYENILTPDDIEYFPDLPVISNDLLRVGELESDGTNLFWSTKNNKYPSSDISLRNISNERVDIVCIDDNNIITSVDLVTAKFELYPGAIYLHDGFQYKVIELDLLLKQAKLKKIESNYFTVPFINIDVDVINIIKRKRIYRCSTFCGDIKVTSFIYAYKKISFFRHINIGYEDLEEPLFIELETEGVWFNLPDNLKNIKFDIRFGESSMMQRDSKYDGDGILYALKTAAEMRIMADYGDIGTTIFKPQDSSALAILLYDKYKGGLGFSLKIYELLDKVINDAIRIIESCKCENGCPACVGNDHIDKNIVLWALYNLKEESNIPTTIISNEEYSVLEDNKHTLEWVARYWWDFIKEFETIDMDVYYFISSVRSFKNYDNTLELYIKDMNYINYENDDNFIDKARIIIQNRIKPPIIVKIILCDESGSYNKNISSSTTKTIEEQNDTDQFDPKYIKESWKNVNIDNIIDSKTIFKGNIEGETEEEIISTLCLFDIDKTKLKELVLNNPSDRIRFWALHKIKNSSLLERIALCDKSSIISKLAIKMLNNAYMINKLKDKIENEDIKNYAQYCIDNFSYFGDFDNNSSKTYVEETYDSDTYDFDTYDSNEIEEVSNTSTINLCYTKVTANYESKSPKKKRKSDAAYYLENDSGFYDLIIDKRLMRIKKLKSKIKTNILAYEKVDLIKEYNNLSRSKYLFLDDKKSIKALNDIQNDLINIFNDDESDFVKVEALRGIEDLSILKKVFQEKYKKDYRLAALDHIVDEDFLTNIISADKSKVVREKANENYKDVMWANKYNFKEKLDIESILNDKVLVVIDTETTGFYGSDRICQIGMIILKNNGIERIFEYCNPRVQVNPNAYSVHKLSDNFLQNMPIFKQTKSFNILNSLRSEDCIYVFHNASFDLRFIGYEGIIIPGIIIDTMSILKVFKCFSDNTLSSVAEFFKNIIPNYSEKEHDALGDAQITLDLLIWLYNAFPYRVGRLLQEGNF